MPLPPTSSALRHPFLFLHFIIDQYTGSRAEFHIIAQQLTSTRLLLYKGWDNRKWTINLFIWNFLATQPPTAVSEWLRHCTAVKMATGSIPRCSGNFSYTGEEQTFACVYMPLGNAKRTLGGLY